MNKEIYAVVTGASHGLGKSFAEKLAQKGIHLILVSLPGQDLPEYCLSLQEKYKIKAYGFETDLSKKDNVINLSNTINRDYHISYLINNAGMGGTVKFEDAGHEYISGIIQLNVHATALLTHQLLPNLKQQEKAHILNVSSLAAFTPIGYKTVYPASKAFVHSFSLGLHEELKNSNVSVSVVNPGPMKTNADVSRRIQSQGLFAQWTLTDPDVLAEHCLKRLDKNETLILSNPISWFLLQLLPVWIKMPLLTQRARKELLLKA